MEYHVKFISFFREIHRSDCVSILVSSISKNIHHCLSELMKTSPLPYPDPPFTAYSYSTRRANPSRNPLDRPARQPRKERIKGRPTPARVPVFQLIAMERISFGSLQPSAKDKHRARAPSAINPSPAPPRPAPPVRSPSSSAVQEPLRVQFVPVLTNRRRFLLRRRRAL